MTVLNDTCTLSDGVEVPSEDYRTMIGDEPA